MKRLVNIFMSRFGWLGVLRLVFYPLTACLMTPLRLAQTLWNTRVLIGKNRSDYNHFSPYNGLNSLFYKTLALNLHRFGRSGHSSSLGLGNYPLARLFSYPLFSLYAYWKDSIAVLLSGMFGWLLIHLVWVYQVNLSWVLIIMFLAAISTTFYANIFGSQNYNVLGWFFFPLGLYGIFSQNWIVAGSAWFLTSFGSPTAVFIASIISIVAAADALSWAPVLALIPAGLKLLTHFYPFLASKNIKTAILNVMKAIGIYSHGAKYKFTFPLKTKLTVLYFLLLYGQFFIAAYLFSGKLPVMFLVGIIIFIVNSSFMRFADIQTTQMLMFSLATATIMQNPRPALLISYWIVISPLPLLIPFPFMKNILDIVPECAPFSIKRLKEGMGDFLAPVKPGERVLMAFSNPGRLYTKAFFDGYITLLQLPLYLAAEKQINFMPEELGVFELNYKGAPDFWGRDLDSVLKNIRRWQADYAVIYQTAGTELDPKWESTGFKVLSKFSWADHEEELRGQKPYYDQTPDWWLMRVP